MVTGNESQAGISPHGIEGVLTCHENPPRGFLSLGFMPLAANLGLRVFGVVDLVGAGSGDLKGGMFTST
jgi:hypothetical protein